MHLVLQHHRHQLAGRVPDRNQAMGQMLAQSECVRGSTILGDGNAAPMLVAPSLVRQSMVKGGQGRPEHGRLA